MGSPIHGLWNHLPGKGRKSEKKTDLGFTDSKWKMWLYVWLGAERQGKADGGKKWVEIHIAMEVAAVAAAAAAPHISHYEGTIQIGMTSTGVINHHPLGPCVNQL